VFLRLTVLEWAYGRLYSATECLPPKCECVADFCLTAQPSRDEAATNHQAEINPQKGLVGLRHDGRQCPINDRNVGGRCYRTLAWLKLSKPLQLALIIGAITASFIDVEEANAVGINDRIKDYWIADCHYSPAIPSNVLRRSGQRVMISRPSPQIKKLPAALHVHDVLWGKRSTGHVRRLTSAAVHLWTDHSGTRRDRRICVVEIKSGWNLHVAKKAVRIKLQTARRSVATVMPHGTYSPIKMARSDIGFIKWLYSTSEYEGALVSNEGVPGELSLSTSSDPEGASERRDYNSCESSNRGRVSVNEIASASNVRNKDGDAGGFIIVGGSIGIGLIVLLYAALKDWREVAFRKIKNRKQRDDAN